MHSRIKKYYIVGILSFYALVTQAQNADLYNQAYSQIESMLTHKNSLNFKKSIFLVEKAYAGDRLNIEEMEHELDILMELVNIISNSKMVTYNGTGNDKDIITKHASLFKILTDSISLQIEPGHYFVHTPYTYDFDDVQGQSDWSKMFVSKLLETGKGNCHSLPYLYKILSDELNIPCYLSFAPNHIYIKLFAESTGWYNTELSSGTFPIDAWIIASGYVNTDAIRNGLYMDTLSTKQAIANCLVDLAQGYQRKYGKDDPTFVIQCCNTVLKYHSVNVNAILTKAEAQKHYIRLLMKKQKVQKPEALFNDHSVKEMYTEMEAAYVRLYQLGYRKMPEEMYMQWIGLLNKESGKYINTHIRLE